MWLVLLSLCMGGILIVEASLVPVLALGAVLGSLVGLIGFFRDNGAELRWFIVSAVGGAIGGALAARYWGEASSGDATRSATEALVMNAVTGMQIALLIGTLALCVGALFALHWRAWPPTRLRPDGNG
jgi:hypothetical protein